MGRSKRKAQSVTSTAVKRLAVEESLTQTPGEASVQTSGEASA